MDKEDKFRDIITATDKNERNGFHIACEQGEQIIKFCLHMQMTHYSAMFVGLYNNLDCMVLHYGILESFLAN